MSAIPEDHFKNLYKQHAPELILFARKFVDIFTAEDIVHDVFLKILNENIDIFSNRSTKMYLLRMVQNACHDSLRHKAVKDNYLSNEFTKLKTEELKWYSSSDNTLPSDEKLKSIYKAIENLPPKCKEIFTKAYLEQKKHADIALELEISIRTVEAQVYKALKLLRDRLLSVFLLSIFIFL